MEQRWTGLVRESRCFWENLCFSVTVLVGEVDLFGWMDCLFLRGNLLLIRVLCGGLELLLFVNSVAWVGWRRSRPSAAGGLTLAGRRWRLERLVALDLIDWSWRPDELVGIDRISRSS